MQQMLQMQVQAQAFAMQQQQQQAVLMMQHQQAQVMQQWQMAQQWQHVQAMQPPGPYPVLPHQQMFRRPEEDKKRSGGDAKKKEEDVKKACAAVATMVQKLRSATPETLDELKKELSETLAVELPKSGDQRRRLMEDSEKALDAAKRAVAQIKEFRKTQEKRAEVDRKKKEMQDRAVALAEKLKDMAAAVPTQAEKLRNAALPLESMDCKVSDSKLEEMAKALEDVNEEVGKAALQGMAFITESGVEIRTLLPLAQGLKPLELNLTLSNLLQQLSTLSGLSSAVRLKTQGARQILSRRHTSRVYDEEMRAAFRKYDRDMDGMLSQKEVQRYAKGEFAFRMPPETLESAWRHLVEEGAAGVTMVNFQRLKVAVGIAREMARDSIRREERLEMERKCLEEGKPIPPRFPVDPSPEPELQPPPEQLQQHQEQQPQPPPPPPPLLLQPQAQQQVQQQQQQQQLQLQLQQQQLQLQLQLQKQQQQQQQLQQHQQLQLQLQLQQQQQRQQQQQILQQQQLLQQQQALAQVPSKAAAVYALQAKAVPSALSPMPPINVVAPDWQRSRPFGEARVIAPRLPVPRVVPAPAFAAALGAGLGATVAAGLGSPAGAPATGSGGVPGGVAPLGTTVMGTAALGATSVAPLAVGVNTICAAACTMPAEGVLLGATTVVGKAPPPSSATPASATTPRRIRGSLRAWSPSPPPERRG